MNYSKTQLMALKDAESSQEPPICRNDPRVNRLDIFKDKVQTGKTEKKLEELRNLLPNVSVDKLDPNLASLLENFHKSLSQQKGSFQTQEDSGYHPSPVRGNSPNFNRRVSWGDQKIPSYDRKNFFDNITTTTMRPPRMGVGSFTEQKSRGNQSNVRSAKGFACANDRNSYYPNNLSAGSLSLNETKSSYDGSTDHNKSTVKDDENESEPEWFSWPVSRHDMIDLHGFDEGDDLQFPEPTARSSDVGTKTDRNSPLKMFDDFARFGQNKDVPDSSSFSRRPNNYRLNRNQNINSFHGVEQNQRSRNPLMHPNSSSGNSSIAHQFAHDQHANEREAMAINPFFEMWKMKNVQQVQQENVNFLNWMKTTRPQMKTISDIEHGMRQNAVPNDFFQGQQQQQFNAAASAFNRPFNGQTVPHFFQQANEVFKVGNPSFPSSFMMPAANASGGRSGYFDGVHGNLMPTQEQLEQHTSEIMRNAILRKQNQNERKFRK